MQVENLYFDILPLHPQPELFESFTSYLSRLIEANNYRTTQEIGDLLFGDSTIHAGKLKSLADFPLEALASLVLASGCSERRLLSTTFFHLINKFVQNISDFHYTWFLKGTVASSLRYCPLCLQNQSVPYYSLLWRFVYLRNCPEHNCPLLDYCTHCKGRIPLFSYPIKVPFCPICRKDLRLCDSPRTRILDEQEYQISHQELEFLLVPKECEAEENISFLLTQRLLYKASTNSMKIVHNSAGGIPRKIYSDILESEMQKKKKIVADEKRIRGEDAMFINYFKYTRYLGITLNDLFDREFFTTLSSDPEEHSKQIFVLSQVTWEL